MGVGDYTAPSTKFSQDEANRLIQRAADGEPQTFHWQIERSNGELRWVRIHLSSTCIDGDRCVISEVQDVTEYRALARAPPAPAQSDHSAQPAEQDERDHGVRRQG